MKKSIFAGLILVPILFCACTGKPARSGEADQSPSKKAIVLEEFVFTESPTRDCHASSLLELANGDLLCTWFGGTREGAPDVNIWLARKRMIVSMPACAFN